MERPVSGWSRAERQGRLETPKEVDMRFPDRSHAGSQLAEALQKAGIRSGRGARIAPRRGARSLRGLGLTGHSHGCDRGAQAWSAVPAGAGHGCPRRGRSAGGESRGAPCGGTRRAHARPRGRSRERGTGSPSRALPGLPAPARPRGAAGGDRRRRHRHRIDCPGRGKGGAGAGCVPRRRGGARWLHRSGWRDWPT